LFSVIEKLASQINLRLNIQTYTSHFGDFDLFI